VTPLIIANLKGYDEIVRYLMEIIDKKENSK